MWFSNATSTLISSASTVGVFRADQFLHLLAAAFRARIPRNYFANWLRTTTTRISGKNMQAHISRNNFGNQLANTAFALLACWQEVLLHMPCTWLPYICPDSEKFSCICSGRAGNNYALAAGLPFQHDWWKLRCTSTRSMSRLDLVLYKSHFGWMMMVVVMMMQAG